MVQGFFTSTRRKREMEGFFRIKNEGTRINQMMVKIAAYVLELEEKLREQTRDEVALWAEKNLYADQIDDSLLNMHLNMELKSIRNKAIDLAKKMINDEEEKR